MVRPSVLESISTVQRALRSASMKPEDLHSVILCGGSSRMPIVTELLQTELGVKTAVDLHPKHDVALGAALMAQAAAHSSSGASHAATSPAAASGLAGKRHPSEGGGRSVAAAALAATGVSAAGEAPSEPPASGRSTHAFTPAGEVLTDEVAPSRKSGRRRLVLLLLAGLVLTLAPRV
jgi:hypothetical protein